MLKRRFTHTGILHIYSSITQGSMYNELERSKNWFGGPINFCLNKRLKSTFFQVKVVRGPWVKEKSFSFWVTINDCATSHTHFGYLHDYLPQSSSPEEKKFKPRRFLAFETRRVQCPTKISWSKIHYSIFPDLTHCG